MNRSAIPCSKNLLLRGGAALAIAALLGGCTTIRQEREPYSTRRDKTAKSAGIGAAAGAAAAILKGEREADEILAGAAIGAAVGGGVGFYMDRQEEKLARIPGTTIERLGQNVLLLRFKSGVLFNTDSATVQPSGLATLDQVADVLLEFKKTAAVVQGHTDSTGTEEHNQALSERRANAVRNHLVSRGVDAHRMTAIGFGEGYPLADNATDEGRRRNRRVEILLKARAK